MMRIIGLFAALVVVSIALSAQDNGTTTTMTGWLSAKCVNQNSDRAVCDQNCVDKTGEIALVGDQGRILKIANQEKRAAHANKRVKMKCNLSQARKAPCT